MIEITLQIKSTPQSQRATHALLIAEQNPVDWLKLADRLALNTSKVRWLPLPTSIADQQVSSVLLTWPDSQQPDKQELGRGQAYGLFGSRLYLPSTAVLTPDIDPAEMDQLIPQDRVMIWHPNRGLINCETEDILTTTDLLEIPVPQTGTWNAAIPGFAVNQRLASLQGVAEADPDQILNAGRDGIGDAKFGSRPGAMQQNIADNLKALAGLFVAPLVPLLKHLEQKRRSRSRKALPPRRHSQRQSPTTSKPSSPRAWRLLQSLQQRQLNRLLKMLNENPDLGLKYAIPFGGLASPRFNGFGTQLFQRLVNFDLGTVFANQQAAAAWDLDAATSAQLTRKYEELAQRESALGRHRRAAYIYAQLLNDLSSAAAVLKAGHHYREAAIIYEKKLYNPGAAADCLKEGGLYHDAIRIYELQGRHETVGDLYTQLDDSEQAEAAYRKAVDAALTRYDHLKAGHLLDRKLNSPDEALQAYQSGSRSTRCFSECVQARLDIHVRLNRHELSDQLLQELANENSKVQNVSAALRILTTAADQYPNAEIRHQAKRTATQIVSKQLINNPTHSKNHLAELSRLWPDDQLFEHDTVRFLRNVSKPRNKSPNKPTKTNRWRAETIAHSTELRDQSFRPLAATAHARHIFLYGTNANQSPFVAVGHCSGNHINWRTFAYAPNEWAESWKDLPNATDSEWNAPLMALPSEDQSYGPDSPAVQITYDSTLHCLYVIDQHRDLSPIELSISDNPTPMKIESPAWLTERTAALYSDSGICWTVTGPGLTLRAFSSIGVQIKEVELGSSSSSASPLPWKCPIAKVDDLLFVAYQNQLFQLQLSKRPSIVEFDRPIRSLEVARNNSLPQLAVLCDQGGAILWPRSSQPQRLKHLPTNLNEPNAVFVGNRRCLILAEDQAQLYSCRTRHLDFLGAVEGVTEDRKWVLDHPEPDCFLTIAVDGCVRKSLLRRG